jgi:antitoxin component YwqK of YwqJK toxin-antitoxin module
MPVRYHAVRYLCAVMLHRLLIFLLLCLPAYVSPAQSSELNTTDAKGRKQGAWAKSWDNGKLRYQGQFKDDLPQGEFRHYDEEGQLTTIQNYEGDGGTSQARHLHPDGNTMAEGRYVGQQKAGEWRYYDAQGRLRRVENYHDGAFHGEVIIYYGSGRVAEKDEFQKGKLHGPSRSWFENGILRSEETYVNGVMEGKTLLNYPSGKKELEGSMKNGQRHGTWFHFNPDGSVHVKLLYANGKLKQEFRENGTFREYFGDERPRSEITYKNGKREGPFVEYHDNGRWVIKNIPSDPVSGAKADVERELQGQTKKLDGTYKNDQLHGEVKEYDEKGKLVKVTRYDSGVVLGEEVKR